MPAQKQRQFGESGVQDFDRPREFGRLWTQEVICGRGGRRVATCSRPGIRHVVAQSLDNHLDSLIGPTVQAP